MRDRPYDNNDPHRMRNSLDKYVAMNPERPMDLSHPNGANPGNVIDAPPYHPKGDENIHGMRLPPQPNQPHAFHPNGANPGDVNADESQYDLFTDPNIQDAFMEYLERERPELLIPSVLDIPTRPHTFSHFAVFPETLVEPLVKAGCPPGGVVLDPFAGSGTIGVVAKKQGKNAILIEISPEYCNIIKKRLNWGDGLCVEYEEFPKETLK